MNVALFKHSKSLKSTALFIATFAVIFRNGASYIAMNAVSFIMNADLFFPVHPPRPPPAPPRRLHRCLVRRLSRQCFQLFTTPLFEQFPFQRRKGALLFRPAQAIASCYRLRQLQHQQSPARNSSRPPPVVPHGPLVARLPSPAWRFHFYRLCLLRAPLSPPEVSRFSWSIHELCNGTKDRGRDRDPGNIAGVEFRDFP